MTYAQICAIIFLESEARKVEELINILMHRDNLSRFAAEQQVYECADAVYDAIALGGGYDEVADLVEEYLGLEPDYITNIIEEYY